MLMVRLLLSFVLLRITNLRPPSTATPSAFLDIHLPAPTPASVIFAPTHDFYDPYCGDFNQFGWINHRGIWSSHHDPQGH